MIKNLKIKDYCVILSVLLFISISLNVYSYMKVNKYKYEIGRMSQLNVEDIRQRNESNMDILKTSIEQGSMKNEELIKLYKNYDIITSKLIQLLEQYNSYKDDNFSIFSKKINTKNIIDTDINIRTKDYLLMTLNSEMKNNKSGLILDSDNLYDFSTIYELTKKMYDYFENFYSTKLLNLNSEEKEKKIIKNNYWIDMVEGIYNISDNYTNIQFNEKDSDSINNVEIINDEKNK